MGVALNGLKAVLGAFRQESVGLQRRQLGVSSPRRQDLRDLNHERTTFPMRQLLFVAAPVLAVATFASASSPQEPGSPAPEFTSGTWFNHIGQSPSIASLKGKAILLEFWATW